MKLSFATALTVLAAAVSAAPAEQLAPRAVTNVQVVFSGPSGSYTLPVPDNDTGVQISNPLEVTQITANASPGTTCSFDGFQGSHVNTDGTQTVNVALQKQVFATCVSPCQRTGNGC